MTNQANLFTQALDIAAQAKDDDEALTYIMDWRKTTRHGARLLLQAAREFEAAQKAIDKANAASSKMQRGTL